MGSEFDISMIKLGEKYVVNCPTKQLERELEAALDDIGLHYPDGESLSNHCHWAEFEEGFWYFIYEDSVARRGKKPGDYKSGIKCTFYGIDTPDFDVASDDELQVLFGIGGG